MTLEATTSLFARFWGFVGALRILNLWLDLYNADGE